MKTSARTFFRRSVTALTLAALVLSAPLAFGANVGDVLQNANIRDANDNPAVIPGFGQKVLAIFYTDPDVSDQNDPFADMLKAANLPKDRYQGIGIANMKDAPWMPNSVIRAIIRRKIAKYDSVILTDPDRLLIKTWNLGDCDDKSLVFVIGKDQKVHYLKKGPMTEAERKSTLALVQQLIAGQ